MPVLLIIGQSDRSIFFRRYARPEDIKPLGNWPALGRAVVKQLADEQLVEIGAGHVSHLDRPQEFLDALAKFLASRPWPSLPGGPCDPRRSQGLLIGKVKERGTCMGQVKTILHNGF
jgi:hypothetical protein